MRRPLALVSLAAAAWSAPALAPLSPTVARALRIPRRVPASDAVVLSFDDGPHPDGTPAVLERLRGAGARAVFFLAGEQVLRFPALAAEIAAEGHTIGLHCHRHRNMLRLSARSVGADLDAAAAAIGEASGGPPALHRPPYGIYSPAGLAQVRARGLAPLLWSRWGHDWRARRGAARIAAEASAGVCAGDVILLHDADHYSESGSWRDTVAALPAILAAVGEQGLSLTLP